MTSPPAESIPAVAAVSPAPPAGPAGTGDAAARAEERRSHRLGVLNGALFQAGEGFIDSTTVIPVFVSRLTSSSALIGLCTSLGDAGWFLPQFAVAPRLAQFPRLLWLYRRAALVRALALGILAALTIPFARTHPGALLGVFLACYGVYSFGAGVAAIPFVEVVSKTIPRERLGAFWSQRLFWGGLLAAGAGLMVREVSRIENPGLAYAILFGLAMVLVSIGYGCFSAIREPAGPPGESGSTPLSHLREGLAFLRHDPSFRRLFLARASLSLWLTASPFMVLFAVRDLGGGPGATGTFLFARVTGFVLSNLAWQPLSRRCGNRALMKIAAGGCSAVAVAAAAVAVASPWSLGWLSARASVLALEVVACVGGAVQSGMIVGFASLLIELAPHGRRPSFVSLMNSFLGTTMLLPAVGGALVDWFNAPVVFALCAAAALFGYRAAAGLPNRASVAARGIPPAAPGLSNPIGSAGGQ
jgi:hypothetical protein